MTTVELRPMRAALLPFLLLGYGLVCMAAPAHAQGFDCRYAATPDEKMICRDPRLGRLDEELGSAYARQYYDVPGSERGRLDRQEDAWVVLRRRCGADAACIEQSYRRRIEELGGPTRPELGTVGQARQDAVSSKEQSRGPRPEQQPEQRALPRAEERTTSRSEEEVTRRRETAPAYDGAFARPEPGATVQPGERDLAPPEQAVRSEEVEIIEEGAAKPRHRHRRAPRAGKPPTRAEATRALHAAKEEPRRGEQHKPDHAEPAKNAAAAEPAAENPAAAAGEHDAVAKKEAGAHRPGQHAGGGKARSPETASRTAASASAAPRPPQSGSESGRGSAGAQKDNGPPAGGSAPSISWVNPPPVGGK